MSDPSQSMIRARQATTDVFDPVRRTFLVKYPIGLVVGLALSGVAAFLLVGFFGYKPPDPAEPHLTYELFKAPWPLFLWFCALIMTLQVSILRNRALRGRMVAALAATLISMLIVGAAYFYGQELRNLLDYILRQVLHIAQSIPEFGNNPYTYSIINFGLIAVFWFDTIRRWIRGARGQTITPGEDIGLGDTVATTEDNNATLTELVSGDLIAGAVLTLLLSLIFRAGVINFFSDALQVHVNITTCTVSWPFGHCAGGAGLGDPPTLSFLDLLQTLLYLPLGLLILAISATLSGLAAGGGVNESERVAHASGPAAAALTNDQRAGAVPIAQDVAATVLNTLRSAISRRLRRAPSNITFSLRSALWPVLVLIGTIAVASAARAIQQYLHILSDQRTCTEPGFLSCDFVKQNLLTFGQPYASAALVLLWGAVAVLAITFSVALMLFRWRVAENALQFLGFVGLIVLLTFWIFSLALSGFNGLFWLIDHTVRVPFPQPGATTIISFAALVVGGGLILLRRGRGQGAPSTVRGASADR